MHLALKYIDKCNKKYKDNLFWRQSIFWTMKDCHLVHLDSGDPSWSPAWFQRRTLVRFFASPCQHFGGCRRQATASQTLTRKFSQNHRHWNIALSRVEVLSLEVLFLASLSLFAGFFLLSLLFVFYFFSSFVLICRLEAVGSSLPCKHKK